MAEVDSEDSLAVMIVWHLGLKHERRDIITRSVIKKTLFIPRDKKGIKRVHFITLAPENLDFRQLAVWRKPSFYPAGIEFFFVSSCLFCNYPMFVFIFRRSYLEIPPRSRTQSYLNSSMWDFSDDVISN